MFICALVCLISLFKKHEVSFYCTNNSELYNKFLTHKEKYDYKKLNSSYCEDKLGYILSYDKNLLFCEKYLYKKKAFLLTLSKLVDYKINSNNSTFRSKNDLVLIEEIASVVANRAITSNKCNLFKEYNKLRYQYSLKQKEEKIFKLLLAQKLIFVLCNIEHELKQISKVIVKSKTTTKLKKYKKQILFNAEVYGISKFNANYNKILLNFKEKSTKSTNILILELLNAELKIKIIIEYLSVMFSWLKHFTINPKYVKMLYAK